MIEWIDNPIKKGKTAKRTIKILFATDTSMSIDTNDFLDFESEIRGILNTHNCKITVIHCDTQIQKIEQLHPYKKLHVSFKGRGGTSMLPVFKYYNEKSEYDLLIYFTDLYGDEYECHSPKNVIWVTTRNYNKGAKPGCGRLVHIHD